MSEANPSKLTSVELTNFGPLQKVVWPDLADINLIIGTNGSGKTFLLKALYASIKSLETLGSMGELRNFPEIVAHKLHWTFQADKIGDLVKKGEDSLSLKLHFGQHHLSYQFGRQAQKHLSQYERTCSDRKELNSVFLPTKEVLSLHNLILSSRLENEGFYFDDTYYDLVRALEIPTKKGNNLKEFASARSKLSDTLGGVATYNSEQKRWVFGSFPMGVMAEGIKKIALLHHLLGNRYLRPGSIVFIDEPESALHPQFITELLAIVHQLSQQGIQFFMATHSYAVINELYLLAQKHKTSVACLSLSTDGEPQASDLLEGMPDNPIINHAISQYHREIEL